MTDLERYAGERLALLGVGSDENSSFLRGCAQAPAAVRAALHSESTNWWTELGRDLAAPGQLFDAGDVDAPDDFEAVERDARALLERGARLLSIGGDHAVTHPLVRAHAAHHADLSILHFDAHPDLYADFGGNPRSHASPFARILEEGLARRLVQVGIRTANAHQRAQVARYGVEVVEMREWARALELVFEGPVYLSFDVDVLDPAFAPGVSHQEPGGASTRQVLDLIQRVPAEIVGADVVELNPTRDPSGVTAMTAARVLREIAGRMLDAAG